jgi:D-3-phosphoglycerate dehydrogenase / 2-oxoglutarate reductase
VKVLVSDKMAQEGIDIFEQTPDIQVDFIPGVGKDVEELKKIIGQYHGIAIRSGTQLTREIIELADNLKVIGRAGIGVDNVDQEAASERGIVVMNTPGGNTTTTAEHTIAMMMALVRNIPQANASMKSGKWEKPKFLGTELFNKTIGVIGLGHIGQIVANRTRGLQMNVLAFDPFISKEKAARLGVEVVGLDEIFANSDIITIHTPKTEQTTNLINAESIAKMKDGVFILNCARGGLVNEQDLVDAIDSGKVAGAAADVYISEPPPEDHPYLKCDKIICTPHLGASTEEAQVNVAVDIAKQISNYLLHGIIQNSVNVPSMTKDEMKTLKPFLKLAEKLGSFMGQYVREAPEKITLSFDGEVAGYNIAPLRQSCLKGLLQHTLPETVNYVNAPIVAQNRGIQLIEQKSTIPQEYKSSITLRVAHAKGVSTITGTFFGTQNPRIVKIDDYYLEVFAEGNILVVTNKDAPGVVGNIGTIFATESINIAGMQLGRQNKGEMAISLIRVDEKISEPVLKKIRSLPNITGAELIILD